MCAHEDFSGLLLISFQSSTVALFNHSHSHHYTAVSPNLDISVNYIIDGLPLHSISWLCQTLASYVSFLPYSILLASVLLVVVPKYPVLTSQIRITSGS